MIPLTLSLRNFLSYGDQLQTIDFSHYSLICLSGKNGHGKSALLDAMTWALWGQARKISGTSKADAGLLRLGATRMLVSFEFIFNGRRYRVRREFAQTYGKPHASLDFEIYDDGQQGYVSLTDKTIRQTQAKIEQLIGLDFDTYINSAFLRQGQSNEFSKKSPRERKQILASILGVSLYDALQTKAAEKGRTYSDEKKIVQALCAQNTAELSKQTEIDQQLQQLHKDQIALTVTFKEITEMTTIADKKREALLVEKNEHQRLLHTLQEQQKHQTELERQLIEQVKIWKTVHARSLHMPSVEKLSTQRKALVAQETELRTLAHKTFELQNDLIKVKDAYHKRMTVLKSEHEKKMYEQRLGTQRVELMIQQLLAQAAQKEKRLQECKQLTEQKEKDRLQVAQLLKEQTEFEKTYGATKTQFDKRRTYHQVLVSRGQWIDQQLAEISHKRDALCDQQSPACPTCEQVLTAKRRTFLVDKFQDQEKVYLQRRKRIASVVKNLKTLLLDQHKVVEKLEQQKGGFVQGAVRAQELEGAVKDIVTQAELLTGELTTLQVQKKELETQLSTLKVQAATQEKEEFFKDTELAVLQQRMMSVETEQKALRYDKAHHDVVSEALKQIELQLTEWEQTQKMVAEQQHRRQTMRMMMVAIKELKIKLKEAVAHVAKFADLPGKEADLKKEYEVVQVRRVQAESTREKIAHQLGSIEREKQRLDQLAKELVEREKQLKVLSEEIESYQTLAQAFGKDGIQALLIEDAIPEIENEANSLLSKLTDNQSQIFIESLRDLKKGGVKETLDIQISDAAGVRPYEMFSGGEAFRIDFALRIAISKLLARRAGTALQTLIIDEGFGSQDDEGLGRLMDSLYAVQSDFSKIIVVSHLPSMKDNFPVHFVIEKGAQGSMVSVQERG